MRDIITSYTWIFSVLIFFKKQADATVESFLRYLRDGVSLIV